MTLLARLRVIDDDAKKSLAALQEATTLAGHSQDREAVLEQLSLVSRHADLASYGAASLRRAVESGYGTLPGATPAGPLAEEDDDGA